jgi:hypothetical protein
MSPPSSGSKNKPSKKIHTGSEFSLRKIYLVGFEIFTAAVMTLHATCFHAGSLLGLFFDPEDGGYMSLRNVI